MCLNLTAGIPTEDHKDLVKFGKDYIKTMLAPQPERGMGKGKKAGRQVGSGRMPDSTLPTPVKLSPFPDLPQPTPIPATYGKPCIC